MSNQINNRLIAKNTFVLYMRMLFTLAISLFITRKLLLVLGVEDFGLYNVVGGIVLMFGFLNNAMLAASQRFITITLGEGNIDRQKNVFSTSLSIHITIAVIVLILAETVGLWILTNKMTIPEIRYEAVNWVYQAAMISFVCQIIQVPFSSSVIAHEKMTFYAIVCILDAILKLVIVCILPIFNVDKLKLYSILLLSISLINLMLYILYTRINFKECRFVSNVDKGLFREMLSFAGWSFIGNFGFSAKDYGVNILLNIVCGASVNAARGVAYQVMNAVMGFVANFQTAMNPQITKRYAAGEVDSMVTLVKNGSRYSFYLLTIIVVPLFIRAEYVLNLWLDNVPDMTIQFLRLTLIMALVNSMFGPLVTAMQATGKIKVFQITIAIIMFLDLPIAYILLELGCPPYSVMYTAIGTAFVGLLARAVLLNQLIKIDLKDFIINIVLRNFIVAVIIFLPVSFVSHYFPQTFLGLIQLCVVSVLWSTAIIYISLNTIEKAMVREILMKWKRIN